MGTLVRALNKISPEAVCQMCSWVSKTHHWCAECSLRTSYMPVLCATAMGVPPSLTPVSLL